MFGCSLMSERPRQWGHRASKQWPPPLTPGSSWWGVEEGQGKAKNPLETVRVQLNQRPASERPDTRDCSVARPWCPVTWSGVNHWFGQTEIRKIRPDSERQHFGEGNRVGLL